MGEIECEYTVPVPDRVDVAKLRHRLGLSQSGFALHLGLDSDPITCGSRAAAPRSHREQLARRNWESNRRVRRDIVKSAPA